MENLSSLMFDKDVQEFLKENGVVPMSVNDLLQTRKDWDEKNRNPKSNSEPIPTYVLEGRIFIGFGRARIKVEGE